MINTNKKSNVKAWLLAWNPKNYDWENVEEQYSYGTFVSTVKNGGAHFETWRCQNTKVKPGDRVYMIKLGAEPRGIIASGYATSESYVDDGTRFIDLLLTSVMDYREGVIIPQDKLKAMFPDQQWSPQGSGIAIKVDAARWLIDHWDDYTNGKTEKIASSIDKTKITYLTEIVASLKLLGGTASLSEINSKILERGLLPAIKTNQTWRNTVRSEIQRHCSKTQSYVAGNEDLFYSVYGLGKGVWGLIDYDPDDEPEVVEVKPKIDYEKYSKKDFLKDVFITEQQYKTLVALLENKMNIILQGAPGVGKTFAARRLAWSIMGEKDDSRIEFIQFHQSYSYEDFIMGYRPNDDGGFTLKEGVFYQFCEKARNDPNKKYFFIIDEINRGNLSKIFGELLMLIEKDYRKESARLAYREEYFSVPENLYIIGMMNTADRSLAMIDYALRRRFSFFDMNPGFDSDGFKKYQNELKNDTFNRLVDMVKLLNDDIAKDSSLGKGFCIGHSHFCNLTKDTCTIDSLRSIAEYDIIPMLCEYWFDDNDSLKKWSANLKGIFNDD